MVNELQSVFRRWVNNLEVGTNDRPLADIIRSDGKVLDFNYEKERKPQSYLQVVIDVAQENVFDLIGQYDEELRTVKRSLRSIRLSLTSCQMLIRSL